MNNFLDNDKEASELIKDVLIDLEEISYALEIVGNKILANKLMSCKLLLSKAKKLYDEAINEANNKLFEQAQQGCANMINAALAINKLKEKI